MFGQDQQGQGDAVRPLPEDARRLAQPCGGGQRHRRPIATVELAKKGPPAVQADLADQPLGDVAVQMQELGPGKLGQGRQRDKGIRCVRQLSPHPKARPSPRPDPCPRGGDRWRPARPRSTGSGG